MRMNVEHLPDIRKGDSDWRDYRALQLPNGVTCVLVHDKESKYTAMATTVDAGASSDPRSMSGLAHFTEHMCFLGSEKYPGENEYKRFLSCHGGHSNASTSMGYTTFKFDILADHAEKAIDIFSNFFVSPLFTQSGTNREVNAVDSENSKNIIADGRRRLQILKALADPNHHYSKFSTGNAITLPAAMKEEEEEHKGDANAKAKQVREALLAFHKRHYRPPNMTVVCVGPQSLDTLQEWVVPRYATIKDKWMDEKASDFTEMECLIHEAAKDAPPNRFGTPKPPYNPAFKPELQRKWPILLTTLPLKSMRKLVLNFPLPPVRYDPDRSPVSILSHLLGHEGPGSTFALLQDSSLLTSLSAGSRISSSDQCLLQIDINLTEEGEAKWKHVSHIVFQHCRLIYESALAALSQLRKQHGNGDTSTSELDFFHRMWNEIITLSSIHFHQTSPNSAYSLAPNLAVSVLMNGTQNCMAAGYCLEENSDTLPLEELVEFASLLTPQNCILERCSRAAWDEAKAQTIDHDNDNKQDDPIYGLKTEKWYGVEYCLSEINHADITLWNSTKENKLQLPKENLFIPHNLELSSDLPPEAHSPRIEKEIDPPNLVIEDETFGRLWHRLDDRYALPKASLTFFMRNASVDFVKDDVGHWTYQSELHLRSQMLISIFSAALAQETYDASLAGLHWSLSKSSSGITLACGGYSEKISLLASKLLRDFFHNGNQTLVGGQDNFIFLKESLFDAIQDRTIRNLKSYLQSNRADSLAMYYSNFLSTSRGQSVENLIAHAESITFEALVEHYHTIISDPEMKVECLFTGNVSEKEAKTFFTTAQNTIQTTSNKEVPMKSTSKSTYPSWIPGPLERRLPSGQSTELHFQSSNLEEENGAVVMTFQSPVPGYKGLYLSSKESLRTTIAIRLISHILREPLFDELRTKQQLGYVVQSFYDRDYSIKTQDSYESHVTQDDLVTPVDFIIVNVLSRKVSPPEVAYRIDEFLKLFRQSLIDMPESEIMDHADALKKQLLKPIQKLGTEASLHFGKIRLLGPEVLDNGDRTYDLPWNTSIELAQALQTITRNDLLDVWDQVVAGRQRSRIVSHVYGKVFPIADEKEILKSKSRQNNVIVGNLNEVMTQRNHLLSYNSYAAIEKKKISFRNRVQERFRMSGINKNVLAAAVIGFGVLGFGLHMLNKKENQSLSTPKSASRKN